jgi:hypothetical protein
MDEILAALERCHVTSIDSGCLHNEMLFHLPLTGKKFLLSTHNLMWTKISADAWKAASVILVTKLDQDLFLVCSRRPIGLAICLCKKMERKVSRCLAWVLQSQNLLYIAQCGFTPVTTC